jgi:hypothetical protein
MLVARDSYQASAFRRVRFIAGVQTNALRRAQSHAVAHHDMTAVLVTPQDMADLVHCVAYEINDRIGGMWTSSALLNDHARFGLLHQYTMMSPLRTKVEHV